MQPVYLDHSATTPMHPAVLEAMMPYLTDRFGNAGSVHGFGRRCRRAVDDARDQVAALIHAEARDIVFTSGGTESDNLAIRGLVAAQPPGRRRILVSPIEHPAVLHAADHAMTHGGATVAHVPVDSRGVVDVDALAATIDDATALVSVMHANNETGVIQPVEAIAAVCRERGVTFHSDTVQSAGKLPIDVMQWPVDLAALSAHKINGPKGAGACYVRKGVDVAAQTVGGFQERERRAGTENVAGIVGFGKACELALRELASDAERMAIRRDALQRGILETIPGTAVNGGDAPRLPNLLNIGFQGVEGESVVLALDVEGIAVSSGSTCSSGAVEASHVLLAMGQTHEKAQGAVRFSLGRGTTGDDVQRVLDVLPRIVERIRSSAPLSPASSL